MLIQIHSFTQKYTHNCIHLPNLSATGGIHPKVNFKQSTADFKLEFSFFLTSYNTKTKESSLHYNLPIAWVRIVPFMLFPKSFSMKWNSNYLIQDLNLTHQVHFPKTITTMPLAPPCTLLKILNCPFYQLCNH